MAAVVGRSFGDSCRTFTRNGYGITPGISVISATYASSANSDACSSAADINTSPPITADIDAGPTDARVPYTGTAPANPDAGTTYPAGTIAFSYSDDAPDTGDAAGSDSHFTAPSPTADASAGLRI